MSKKPTSAPAKRRTPTKGKAKLTSTPPKRNTSNRRKSTKKPKSKLWRRLLAFIALLTVLFAIFMGVAGYYFNKQINARFAQPLFELPTVVYARVLTLTPGEDMSLDEVRKELDALNYRWVQDPQKAGEYSSSSSRIELIRRPFDFDDGSETQQHVMLYFEKSKLTRIQSLDKKSDLAFLRIEPKILGVLESQTEENRFYLDRTEFPESMVQALIATEDRNFYQHKGVSPLAIVRAFVVNIKEGRTVQGGSTLTQQLAKNLFLSNEKTLWRKFKEAYIALILDYRYNKDYILEAYLNEVYLGQNGGEAIHGFALASHYYFGVPLNELRIDQQAMLVGMIKGPSYYNPSRRPEETKERRDVVLSLMKQQGILTAEQYSEMEARSLGVQKRPHVGRRQPAYFEQLRYELHEKVGDKFQRNKGMKIFTTLDPISQQYLEEAIVKTLPELEKRSGEGLEAAAVAVDRQTGEIRAMIGGRRVGYDGFNRALNASRQIGSLAKPAVYLTALKNPDKYTLATTLKDQPLTLRNKQGSTWSPKNFDHKYSGQVPLYLAMAKSLNIPTVNLGMQVKISEVMKTLIDLGVDKDEVKPVPSMFLGAYTLTPYQVSQMFQTITNSGKQAPLSALRSVVDQDGRTLYTSLPKSTQKIPEQAAWLTTYIMKRGVSEGTARYLQSKHSSALLAAKTGTSNDSRDSWFVGVDGREVVTIWTGRDDDKPTKLTGASGSLRIYASYLDERAPQKLSLPWPKEITTRTYSKTERGVYQEDCQGTIEFPVWDAEKKQAASCQQQKEEAAKTWIESIFSW